MSQNTYKGAVSSLFKKIRKVEKNKSVDTIHKKLGDINIGKVIRLITIIRKIVSIIIDLTKGGVSFF